MLVYAAASLAMRTRNRMTSSCQFQLGQQHPDFVLKDDQLILDYLGEMGWEFITGYVRSNVLSQNASPGWLATYSSPTPGVLRVQTTTARLSLPVSGPSQDPTDQGRSLN